MIKHSPTSFMREENNGSVKQKLHAMERKEENYML